MGAMVSQGLVIPAAILAVFAYGVPQVLSRSLPEGVRPLILNTLLSTIVLFALSTALFVLLYFWQGLPIGQLSNAGLAASFGYFGRLGLMAAIIWAPIMVLSVAGLPRKWVEETW
jgi:hypothetical protein